MRTLLPLFLLFICRVAAGADYLNTKMVDIIQFERGVVLTAARQNEILNAFKLCTDPEVRKVFVENDYFDEQANNGMGTYVTYDSLKWALRARNTCYIDLDGDGQKEILFHEKDLLKRVQLSVLLKKNDQEWDVVYREYGVFSGMQFEGRMLKGLTSVEYHQFANPCDIFKLYQVKAFEGQLTITPRMKVHVPHFYHSPVKVENPQRPVSITTDTLYFYDSALYNQMDFPYKKEMRNEFMQDRKFNSHESQWFSLVPATIYWAGYVENRGDFSSLLIAFNPSFATDFPEYLFLYVRNIYFTL